MDAPTPMSCKAARAEVAAGEHTAALQAHLAACPACASFAADLRGLIALAARLPRPAAPPLPPRPRAPARAGGPALALAGAALVALLLLGGPFVLQRLTPAAPEVPSPALHALGTQRRGPDQDLPGRDASSPGTPPAATATAANAGSLPVPDLLESYGLARRLWTGESPQDPATAAAQGDSGASGASAPAGALPATPTGAGANTGTPRPAAAEEAWLAGDTTARADRSPLPHQLQVLSLLTGSTPAGLATHDTPLDFDAFYEALHNPRGEWR